MNKEIKEILVLQNYVNRHKSDEKAIINHSRLTTPLMLDYLEVKILLDYITNLQQEIKEANDSITWWTNRFKAVERDNRELKEELEEEKRIEEADLKTIQRLEEENERLKDIVVEKDNQLKDMILQKTDYTAVNILEMKLEDYKSRCEKASECIKKDTRWFDSEYARVYGELCNCAGAKGGRLEVMVNPSNALNILQNGSEDK